MERNDHVLIDEIEILKEFKEILKSDSISDENLISLMDVSRVIKQNYAEYLELISQCNKSIHERIKYIYNGGKFKIYGFDYNTGEIKTMFRYNSSHYDRIKYTKRDEQIFATMSESLFSYNVLSNVDDILLECYEKFMKFYDSNKQYSCNIKPINSVLSVNISFTKIKSYVQNDCDCFSNKFEMSFLCDKNSINLNCNSFWLKSFVKKNGNKILSKMYVKISDCPFWMQDRLYEMRKTQLKQCEDNIVKVKKRTLFGKKK